MFLGRGRDRRARAGHLWIYAGEIARSEGACEPGGVVDLLDDRGRFLGRGAYNPASTIRVRLFTRRRDETLDEPFLRRRIAAALEHRRAAHLPGGAERVVFSEGDGLPGLIVDRYGDTLVLQLGTLAMDRRRELIVTVLRDMLSPRVVCERSDAPQRAHEGLEPRVGVIAGGEASPVEVELDGVRFVVAPLEGQKTGLFLDHRMNRRAVAARAAGRRVLDVFCNSGGFSLYALRSGAVEALGIDISGEALEAARRNAAANGVAGRCTFVEGNAFDHLKEMDRRRDRFDLVVLDPPAFTKNARAVEAARRGYKEINLRALRLAAPGGLIFTASCSFHISAEDFLEILRDAAADAGRPVTLVETGGQAPDHPVHLSVPETRYLKAALLRVRD